MRQRQIVCVSIMLILFLALAANGYLGKRQASRKANLARISSLRQRLEVALADRRNNSAPAQPPTGKDNSSAMARAIANALNDQTRGFRSSYSDFSPEELDELSLCDANVSLATQQYASVLQTLGKSQLLDSKSPNNRHAKQMAADAMFESGKYDDALQVYQSIEAQALPQRIAVTEQRAKCLQQLGRDSESLTQYRQLAESLMKQGTQMSVRQNIPAADNAFTQAVRVLFMLFEKRQQRDLAENLADAFSLSGQTMLRLQQHKRAEIYLTNAIEIWTQLIQVRQREDLKERLDSDQQLRARVIADMSNSG